MRLTRLGLVTAGLLLGVGGSLLVSWAWPAAEPANRSTCRNLRELALGTCPTCGIGDLPEEARSHVDGWNVEHADSGVSYRWASQACGVNDDGNDDVWGSAEDPLAWIDQPWVTSER